MTDHKAAKSTEDGVANRKAARCSTFAHTTSLAHAALGALVSMMIEDVLTTSGGGVVGPAPTTKEALELLGREAVDCAVLDVRLMGGSSFRVAEALKQRAIPFLIVTGVDQKTIPAAYLGAPVLPKVFMPHELIDAVATIARRLHAIATSKGETVHEAWNTT